MSEAQSQSPLSNLHSRSELTEPSRKRPRVMQACETCRDRKTRCDGRQPVCIACEKRGVATTCSYDRHKRTVSTVENENAIGERQSRIVHPRNGIFQGPSPEQASSSSNQRLLGEYVPQLSDGSYDRSLDALGTVPNSADESMYGPSSTAALIQALSHGQNDSIAADVHSHRSRQQQTAKIISQPHSLIVPERLPHDTSGATLLPRRRDADDYVHCFWDFVHPLWPVLHKPTFERQYEKIWLSEDSSEQSEFDESTFMSALNLVFALGCKFSDSIAPERRATTANEFYERSRKLFCYDFLDCASLPTVQLLALNVVYLQSSNRANRCWNTLALAIRSAQSIGLHVEEPTHGTQSQLRIEMRRRTWHVLLAFDRLLASAFGRPTASQSYSVPVPTLIDDEYLEETGEGSQQDTVIPHLGLFVYSCHLFDIMGDVAAAYYNEQHSSLSTRQMEAAGHAREYLVPVLTFNRRIDSFVDSLPAWLQARDSDSLYSKPYIRLQQQVLYCRILLVRLTTFRPLMLLAAIDRSPKASKVNTTSTTSSLDSKMIACCCSQGLEAAFDLIDAMYNHMTEHYRSSPWHTVSLTCSALVTILAFLKTRQTDARLSDLETSWSRAISILQFNHEQVRSASEAIQILQALKRQISITRNEAEETTSGNGTQPAVELQDTPISMQAVDDFDVSAYLSGFTSTNNLSDTWFSQQLLDFNWLDMPEWQQQANIGA